MMDALKSLKPWQIGVLAVALIGVAAATYGVYATVSGPSRADLSENQQVIPVTYGDLVNQVTTNGSLVFASRSVLTFGSQGSVGEVLVTEGQQVKEGQPLARLDVATTASLSRAAAQARVNLRNAEDALAEARDPHTPEDIARAQGQVDSARVSLDNAERDLKLSKKDWDAKLEAAQKNRDDALEAYPVVFSKWLGITPGESQVGQAPDVLLASWKVDLAVLFDPSLRFLDIGKGWSFSEGLPSDDTATPWSEPVVYAWLNFAPGEIVPTCESGVAPEQGACIQKEMDDAWDVYQKSDDNLDTVQTQAAKALANAENSVARAKDTLASSEQALADLREPPDALDLALKEAEVAAAQANLDVALQRLEGATIKAPMAGIVSLVNVEAGQTVNAVTTIVEVVDPGVVELDGIVDEIDVLFVRVGATASVTMDALPGQVLQGTVSSIASAAQSQQGVVSYPVRIQVQIPAEVQAREGLSATASIVIREDRNVLLVPLQALYGTFDQPMVKVLSNGRTVERPVVLGNNDDYWVAVQQGLAEGEQVVMEAQQATAGQLGLGQAFRQFQGQVGGVGVSGGGQQSGQRGQGTQGARPTPQRDR